MLLFRLNYCMAFPGHCSGWFAWSYVNVLVKEEWRVTGQSLLYAAYYGIGAIVGNFWTGYLQDTNMRVAEIFLLNAGIAAAVGLMIWIFMRNKKMKTHKENMNPVLLFTRGMSCRVQQKINRAM